MLPGGGPAVTSLAFSRDGTTLASLDKRARVRLWNVPSSKPVATAIGGAIDKNGNGTIDPGEYTAATGGLSMALEVCVEQGALVFYSRHYFWLLGRWRLPVPALLTPGVCRVEHRDEGPGCFRFTLEMTHPLWGRSNPVMAGMAKQFSNAELKALAKYIGSLPGELKSVPQREFRLGQHD